MPTEPQPNPLNETEPYACWSCGAHIPAEDNYCRRCGKGQGPFVDWYYKHWGVVLMLLGAGPFALYFVWRSPVLSRNAKRLYTAAIALFTWYIANAIYNIWTYFHLLFGGMGL
ncbi:MAG: zinc ribbon domain-containing protein [Elusimicrobiales bacterium]|jgi:hypothetical protein